MATMGLVIPIRIPMATTIMTRATSDALALVRVMAWLSPAFPTGGFAYSGGLEAAAQTGLVDGENTLFDWIMSQLRQGSLQLDAKFVSLAHRCDEPEALRDLQNLAEAFAGSAPRWRETMAQGSAFLAGVNERQEFADGDVRHALGFATDGKDCPLPIAVGVATAYGGIELSIASLAFLQAAVGQQLSAAIRLNLMGQSGAARLLDRLEEPIVEAMEAALDCTEHNLTMASPLADVLAARHDVLDGRLFLS